MTQCEGFPIFFEFFMPVQKCGQNDGLDHSQLVVESWNFFGVSLIKQILMYLEMIFGKNKEQTTRQLQLKFDPLPVESAGICLFHERWIKTFYTQPFGQLCIKYGLVFSKMIWSNFATIIWQFLHKKTSFRALEKWKMVFSSNENENFLRQHCLLFQYAPLCTILDHLNKLCHGCGHKIDHLA